MRCHVRNDQAIEFVKKKHDLPEGKEFYEIFEDQYHCKLYSNPDDWLCLDGWMEISEDKYSNWFVLQFGEADDKSI